jgi:hypothetical protein
VGSRVSVPSAAVGAAGTVGLGAGAVGDGTMPPAVGAVGVTAAVGLGAGAAVGTRDAWGGLFDTCQFPEAISSQIIL